MWSGGQQCIWVQAWLLAMLGVWDLAVLDHQNGCLLVTCAACLAFYLNMVMGREAA